MRAGKGGAPGLFFIDPDHRLHHLSRLPLLQFRRLSPGARRSQAPTDELKPPALDCRSNGVQRNAPADHHLRRQGRAYLMTSSAR